MTDTAPNEPAPERRQPITAREHGVRWGDQWDDTPLDRLPVSRLAGLAARLVSTYWWYTTEGTGLTAAGLGVLTALEAEDGLRSGEVAARSSATPSMVSYLAELLERDGYLTRHRDAHDRRVVHLYLTGEGQQKLRDARAPCSSLESGVQLYRACRRAGDPRIPAVDSLQVR